MKIIIDYAIFEYTYVILLRQAMCITVCQIGTNTIHLYSCRRGRTYAQDLFIISIQYRKLFDMETNIHFAYIFNYNLFIYYQCEFKKKK